MAMVGAPSTTPQGGGIDPRVPRFSQAITGVLLLIAFMVAGTWHGAHWAVPILGVILGLGALLGPRYNLWGLLFCHGVAPILRLGPPQRRKDPAPTRFAMLLGALFLIIATVLLFATTGTLYWTGWGLVLIVAALALLAAVTNLCVGCEIYNFLLRQKTRNAQPAEPEDDLPNKG